MHWKAAPDSKMEFSAVPLSDASSYRSSPAARTLPVMPALYGEGRWSELLDPGARLDSPGDKYESWDSARDSCPPPSELSKQQPRQALPGSPDHRGCPEPVSFPQVLRACSHSWCIISAQETFTNKKKIAFHGPGTVKYLMYVIFFVCWSWQ